MLPSKTIKDDVLCKQCGSCATKLKMRPHGCINIRCKVVGEVGLAFWSVLVGRGEGWEAGGRRLVLLVTWQVWWCYYCKFYVSCRHRVLHVRVANPHMYDEYVLLDPGGKAESVFTEQGFTQTVAHWPAAAWPNAVNKKSSSSIGLTIVVRQCWTAWVLQAGVRCGQVQDPLMHQED